MTMMIFLAGMLCFLGAEGSRIEVYTEIGASLYGDCTGIGVSVGAQTPLSTVFSSSPRLDKVIVGAGGIYEGVFDPELGVTILGVDLRAGYRFTLFELVPALDTALPAFMNLRILPSLVFGLAYERIERLDLEYFGGMAFHVAPQLVVDTTPFETGKLQALRLGLGFGYNTYLCERTVQNFRPALFFGWTF